MILCRTGPRGGEKMTFTELSAEEQEDRVGGVSIAEEFGDARVGIAEGGEQVLDELGCGGVAGDHDTFQTMCLATPTSSPFWLCACTAAKILCPSSDSPCLV